MFHCLACIRIGEDFIDEDFIGTSRCAGFTFAQAVIGTSPGIAVRVLIARMFLAALGTAWAAAVDVTFFAIFRAIVTSGSWLSRTGGAFSIIVAIVGAAVAIVFAGFAVGAFGFACTAAAVHVRFGSISFLV